MKYDVKKIINTGINEGWGYHGTERFRDYFHPNISKYFSVFQGHDVIDIGCCSGIFSLSLTEHANSCVGVEYNPEFVRHFNRIKKDTGAPMSVYHADVKDFIVNKSKEVKYDSVFAANVLYHLSDETIELIASEILPNCTKVLFTSRENKPKKKNKYSLHSWQAISKFLLDAGFEVRRLDNDKNIFSEYTSSYENIDRSVERSHTDSILVPILGTKTV